MNIETAKNLFIERGILHKETTLLEKPTVVGYEKKFKWSWMATQLNTFVVVSDYKDEPITTSILKAHLAETYQYATIYYKGWPRGLQAGIAILSVLISSQVDQGAKDYCLQLASGKKWAGFCIPVVYDTHKGKFYYFQKKPMWGRIYFPYFRNMIRALETSK